MWRNSTSRYRNTTKPHQVIADELGVANLLTGAVQRIGKNIRLNVQLIDPKTDRSIWGESYIRKFTPDNIFAIQSEICRSIALELSVMLTPDENKSIAKVPTQSLEAFEAYLKGNEIVTTGNQVRMPEAVKLFQRAVEMDPAFTLAYVGLALSYLDYGTPLSERRISRDEHIKKVEERMEKMHAAANKAFALDYDLPEVQILQGRVKGIEEDLDGVEASFRRAIDLNPSYAEAYYRLGLLLGYRVRTLTYADVVVRYVPDGQDPGAGVLQNRIYSEVASWAGKAVELEPTNASYRRFLADILRSLGRSAEGIAQSELAIYHNPNQASLYTELGHRLNASVGRSAEAVVQFRKSMALDPLGRGINIGIATAFEHMGDFDEAARWTKKTMALDSPVAHLYEARLLEWRGEEELALKAYRQILVDRGLRGANRGRVRVLFDDLRTGRFQEARARYFEAYPQLFEPDLNSYVESLPFARAMADFGVYAMELAAILMATGEREQANRLMDEAWKFYEFHPDIYARKFNETLMLVLKGDNMRGLQVLRSAFDEGFRDRFKFLDARLDPIRSEPEFIAMMHDIDADLAKQLANVRRMEANGELEAIPKLIDSDK